MAVLRFFLHREFAEAFLDQRKIKKWIVAKPICSLRPIQNYAFRLATKNLEGLAVLRSGNYAHEARCSPGPWYLFQFAKKACIIGFVATVASTERVIQCISGRTYTWSAVKSIHFQTGIVRQYDFSRNMAAVTLGFLPGVFLERKAILNYRRQGSETGNRFHFTSKGCCCSGEVSKLPRIRSRNKNMLRGHTSRRLGLAPRRIPSRIVAQGMEMSNV